MFVLRKSSRAAAIATGVMGLCLLLCYPAALALPVWAGWENGPLENAQVVLLAIGLIVALRHGARAIDAAQAHFWRMVAPWWAIFIGRELSWGAVLTEPLQRHPTEGPVFSSSVLWYKPAVYPVLALLLLYSLWQLLRHRQDRVLRTLARDGDFPLLQIGLAIVGMLVMTNAEGHGWFHFTMDKGALQVLEETAEMGVYFGLLAAQWRIAHAFRRW